MMNFDISDEGRLALTKWAIHIARESDDPRAPDAVRKYEQQAEEIRARLAQVIQLKPMKAKAERR
jgi:hypothetical protein